mgnify:CR=1 FL=1
MTSTIKKRNLSGFWIRECSQRQNGWKEVNYADIGFQIDPRTNRIILMGAIDNLVKGAAGQAVQNMNLLFGYKEQEGLELIPMFP